MDADDVIRRFGLQPHPEGGHYVETWRGPAGSDGRAVGTAILFLLRRGERSHWHRVDAHEIWLHLDGDPLTLSIAPDDGVHHHRLGRASDPTRPTSVVQAVVPAGAWQAAATTGSWTLVSCVVTPGFEFAGFELAPPGWEPPPMRAEPTMCGVEGPADGSSSGPAD